MQLDQIKLKQKINNLEELFNKIIEDLIEEKTVNEESVIKYKELKKEILLSLFEYPVHQAESEYFPDVRKALQRFTLNGDPFIPDISDTDMGEGLKDFIEALHDGLDIELTEEEYEELGHEHFYSWFSGQEYAEALIKSQLLILKANRLPENLSHFADEIRSCYAFQQYTAAFALCRTLFEVAIIDLFEKNGLHVNGSRNFDHTVKYFNEVREKNGSNDMTVEDFDPSLFNRIEILLMLPKFEEFNDKMHQVRTKGNSLIHGNSTGTKEEATEMIQLTFQTIHDLYEIT